MSKAYLRGTGQRREASEWLSNERTKETIRHLSRSTGIPVDLLVDVISTGKNDQRGTWIHPRLATRFAIWVSDDTGLTVDQIRTALSEGAISQADLENRPLFKDSLNNLLK
jgi:hypothetical protein